MLQAYNSAWGGTEDYMKQKVTMVNFKRCIRIFQMKQRQFMEIWKKKSHWLVGKHRFFPWPQCKEFVWYTGNRSGIEA